MFSADNFAEGFRCFILGVARTTETVLMDGIVPAVKTLDYALYIAIKWTEKWAAWAAPLIVIIATQVASVAVKIAWLIWEDLIWWGFLAVRQQLAADVQTETAEAATEVAKELPAVPEQQAAADVEPIPAMAATMAATMAAPIATLTLSIEEPTTPPADLDNLTLRELRALAKGKVPGYGKMRKPELLEALQALTNP